MVVPGAHLARRVLAALGICVNYMCWLYVLAICVGYMCWLYVK